MKKSEIEELTDRVLRPQLESQGLYQIVVVEDDDSVGDPALFIDALLRAEPNRVHGESSASVHYMLRQALLESGESRFPHLRVRYPSEEDLEPGVSPETP